MTADRLDNWLGMMALDAVGKELESDHPTANLVGLTRPDDQTVRWPSVSRRVIHKNRKEVLLDEVARQSSL